MSSKGFTRFLAVALSVWALVHAYVFWRLCSVPWVAAHVAWRTVVLTVWASYPVARFLDARGWRAVAGPLEWIAANWVGIVFLLFCALLATDLVTLGGWLVPTAAPAWRGWAVLVALLLSAAGLAQGLQSPVLRHYEVELRGLPPGLSLAGAGLSVWSIASMTCGLTS